MSQPTPPPEQTRITARVIGADPVVSPQERTGRPLTRHSGGVPLLWSAGIVTGLGLAPLLLDRLQFDVVRAAAGLARTVAPAWPAGGEPTLWPPGVATLAWVIGAVVVVLGVAGTKLPSVVPLVLALVLAITTGFAVWSALEVVNTQAWWLAPACILCALAFVAAVRGAMRWRQTGVASASGGAVGRTLWSWLLVVAVLVGGTAVVDAVEAQRLEQASSTAAPLESLRAEGAAALDGLRGSWVPQIASMQMVDQAQAGTYAAEHAALAGRFPVILVRGGDFPSNTLGSEDWLTLVTQTFGSEADAQGWCAANGLGPGQCVPRLIPAS